MKPLELAREERMDMTKIPSDKDKFESYVNQHLMKKDLSVPYLLNEFIKGEEYAANVVCKNGQIYMFQVSNYIHKNISLNIDDSKCCKPENRLENLFENLFPKIV